MTRMATGACNCNCSLRPHDARSKIQNKVFLSWMTSKANILYLFLPVYFILGHEYPESL